MVVQNFLSPVLSSFFQIPSFSPVCYSNVFSFTFNKMFRTLFRLLPFIAHVLPPSFAHMRSLLSLALSFKALLSFYFMSVPSLLFLPIIYFLLSPLWLSFPVLYLFPFSVFFSPYFSYPLPLPVA
jgi:hypothetical protein